MLAPAACATANRDWATASQVMEEMRDLQVRRMPVVDHDLHLVGILSLGDLAAKVGSAELNQTLESILLPAEPDSSGSHLTHWSST